MRVQRDTEKHEIHFTSQTIEEQQALREFCKVFRLGDGINIRYRFGSGEDKHMERILILTKPHRRESPPLGELNVKGGLIDRSDITYLADGADCKGLEFSFVFLDEAHTGCQDKMTINYQFVE